MQIKLNNRLMEVANLVEDGTNVIDVGCDHAFLAIYLSQNQNHSKIIASDIKEGPLQLAAENIKKYGVEKKVILKLGPGIEPIEEDIHTIVISGMGGLNMVGILKYKRNLLKKVDTIILSPNSDVIFVRKEICKLGFMIEEEKLVKENQIIYPIIRFKKGKKKYRKFDYIYGPILRKKKDPLFLEYLDKEQETKEKLLQVLPKKYRFKKRELKKEWKWIQKIKRTR